MPRLRRQRHVAKQTQKQWKEAKVEAAFYNMEYKMMARSPRCWRHWGLAAQRRVSRSAWAPPAQSLGPCTAQPTCTCPFTPALAAWGFLPKHQCLAKVRSAHPLLRLRAELLCASATITSSPSLQPQDDCSVRATSPLLMCADEVPAPAIPPALTHQPTPQPQVSSPDRDGR